MGEVRWRGEILTLGLWGCRLDRVRNAVHIVGPWTTFAILARVGFSIFLVSDESFGSSTPALMLDSEDHIVSFPSDLVALVDRIGTSSVVSSNPCVRTIDLWYSTLSSVLPASKMGVC